MRSSLLMLSIGLVIGSPLPLAAQDSPPAVGEPRVVGEETEAPEGFACGDNQASWIGDSAEGSDISVSESPLQTSVQTVGTGPAAIAFRVTGSAQPLRIEAQPTEGGDPTIELLDSDGAYIADNDDFSESLASRIETSLDAGDYCVLTRSIDETDMPALIQVSLANQPALLSETGSSTLATCTSDTEAEALADGPLELAIAENELQVQASGSTISFYRFTLNEPISLTLKAASNDLDPQMALYAEDGSTLAQNDDSDNDTNSRLDFLNPLAAGSYCIAVTALSPGDGPITLSAGKLDRESYLRTAYEAGQMPPPLDGKYPVEEIDFATTKQITLLNDGRANWHHFTISKPTVITVEAYASIAGGDSKLALFDEFGRLKGENDDSAESTNSFLGPILLEPGRYLLATTDVSRSYSPGEMVRPIGLIFDRFERVE